MSQTPEVNIVIDGPIGVGKNSIITRFMDNKFVDFCDPTHKCITIDNQMVSINLTSNSWEYEALRRQMVQTGDAFIICVSLIDATTLVEAKKQMDYILQMRQDTFNADTVIVLAGTKCDMVMERVVSAHDVQQIADKYDVKYVETSAKCNQNVHEVVAMCASLILEKRKQEQQQAKTHVGQNVCVAQ